MLEKQKKVSEKNNNQTKKVIGEISNDIFEVFEIRDKMNKLLLAKMKKDEISCSRIFFVRHGHTPDCDKSSNEKKPNGVSLSEKGNIQIKKTLKRLRKEKISGNNTSLWCSGLTKRVYESAEILWNGLEILNIRGDVDGLGSIPVNRYGSEMGAKLTAGDIQNKFYEEELKPYLRDNKGENLILVVNKSCISNLENRIKEKKYDYYTGYDYFHGEIREWDFSLAGDFVNKLDRKDLIYLSTKNFIGIIKEITNESELRDFIKAFAIGNIQIWELQNYINAYFRANKELYKTYLTPKITNFDIRIFCIANLIKNGEFTFVKEQLPELIRTTEEYRVKEFIDIISSQCDIDQKKEIIKIAVDNPNLTSELNLEILQYFGSYESVVKPKIEIMRKKSLDEMMNKGENVVMQLGFQDGKYETMDELLSANKIVLIEGEAGSGKSTKLLEIMEHLKPAEDEGTEEWIKNNKEVKTRKFPVYVSLGDVPNLDGLKEKIKAQRADMYGDKKFEMIYLFDGLDEARWDEETRQEIMDYINHDLKGTRIITSRPGTQKGEGVEIETIKLNTLSTEQIDEYVDMHLTEEQKVKWEEWKRGEFLKSIQDNPLVLSMVCNLIEAKESVDDIHTTYDLYDKVVDKRLYDWEKTKTGREVKKTTLEIRKQLLTEISYLFVEKGKVTKEDVNSLIETKKEYVGIIPEDENGEYNLECLSLLQKNENNVLTSLLSGDYSFLNFSLRGFFIVKYILEGEKTEEIPNFLYRIGDILENGLISISNSGGEEKFKKMVDWLQKNAYSPGEPDIIFGLINKGATDLIAALYVQLDTKTKKELLFDIYLYIFGIKDKEDIDVNCGEIKFNDENKKDSNLDNFIALYEKIMEVATEDEKNIIKMDINSNGLM